MADRRTLPDRRPHVTQKVRVGNCRTVYLSTHADASPRELFVRVKGKDCTSEIIGLYDVLARLASLALQYGAPLEKVGDMLLGAKFEPAGIVTGHPRIRFCSSLPDLIGRHLLVECCGREELAPCMPSPGDAMISSDRRLVVAAGTSGTVAQPGESMISTGQ